MDSGTLIMYGKLEFIDAEANRIMRRVWHYVIFGVLVILMPSVVKAQILPKPDAEFRGNLN